MAVSILVIDDSASLRQVVAMTLKAAGYDVLQAGDGREGLALVERIRPDVVLMDIRMPRLDGLAATRSLHARSDPPRIRTLPAPLAQLPILMLTTETQESKKAEGKAAGAKAWMVKPFSPSSLLSAVSKFCIP